VADPTSGEVASEGVVVWRPGHVIRPVDETTGEILRRAAGRLLRKRKREEDEDDDETTEKGGGNDDEIDETALMKLIKGDPGSRRWARYVARLTNLDRPAVENVAGQPEMLFQQLVFPPVAGLLYCFNTLTYKAGEDNVASSGFCCTIITPRRKNGMSSSPAGRSVHLHAGRRNPRHPQVSGAGYRGAE
jgi:hypothetical protein